MARTLVVLAGLAGSLAAGAPTLPGASLYHLGAIWRTDDGRTVTLQELRGRPVVLAMFFSHCEASCPVVVARMKTIESRLADPSRVRFLLVSFDTERDRPERLRRFRERMGLDAGRWTLLGGAEGAVRELAAALGVRYRREADGSFAHSNAIQLLDEEGRPLVRLDGVGTDPDGLLRALEARGVGRAEGTAAPEVR